jgi:hypothetical protein
MGKVTSFPQSVKLKRDETVVFSWITYRSRTHRDRVNAKVMSDPRLSGMMDPKDTPMDLKRMFFGGFKVIVDVLSQEPNLFARQDRAELISDAALLHCAMGSRVQDEGCGIRHLRPPLYPPVLRACLLGFNG